MRELQNVTGISDIGVISQAVDLLTSLPNEVIDTLIHNSPEQYSMFVPQILHQVPAEDRQGVLEILNALSPAALGQLLGRK